MAISYVDTSALLKFYIFELGSAWMQSDVRPDDIAVSWLTTAEVGAALARRTQSGEMTPAQARTAWRSFREDTKSFILVRLTYATMMRAAGIAGRSAIPLRTLDAIQLQGAIDARAVTRLQGVPEPRFITADTRLELAAQDIGFATDNPLRHP